jgi:pyruvate/2-oxoglutarate dehydrogenase complex dihydrolipoamide acyltransferase (E2) component
MYQFKLPDLGEGIAKAEMVEWHVQEGDIVEENQLMGEIMTAKAVMEIPSPKSGRVHRLCAVQGDVIPVGHVLIEIDEGDVHEAVPADAQRTCARPIRSDPDEPEEGKRPHEGAGKSDTHRLAHAHVPPPMPPRPQAHPVATSRSKIGEAVDAVPAVREFAKQLDVDIERVPGTGPNGRVMRRDVEAFHEAMERGAQVETRHGVFSERPATPDEADWTRQPLRPLRRRIAERMTLSKTIIPHYTYVEEIDMTVLEESRRTSAKAINGKKISPLAFIAHAVVRALPKYPQINASIDEQTGEIILKGKIHLGIAVATEAGLVVPVVRNATGRGVAELAAQISDLAGRARKKRLNLSELKGSTITITSLGKLGGLMATPIINYPESAIIGVHAIRILPRYVGDSVEPRKIMNLSISLDHRLVDGFECAQFISEVKEILETADFPEFK